MFLELLIVVVGVVPASENTDIELILTKIQTGQGTNQWTSPLDPGERNRTPAPRTHVHYICAELTVHIVYEFLTTRLFCSPVLDINNRCPRFPLAMGRKQTCFFFTPRAAPGARRICDAVG
jgi:hypothetical protein